MTGVFCAVVSHPADNLVSKLNAMKGATVGDAVREMGVVGLLTRGLGLRIVMIGKAFNDCTLWQFCILDL